MAGTHQETRIGRLQLHTIQHGTVATQVGLRQTLHQARLQPPHLPTSAILVIRRLHDLPSYPRLLTAARRWKQQLQDRIAALSRRAVRPDRQPGAHDADCVLFMDASDMLACYAGDVIAHRLPWYWHELFSLFPVETVGAQLMTAWCTYPQALPAALVLMPPVAAAQAIAALSRPECLRLAQLLHRTFNLSEQVLLAMSEDEHLPRAQIDSVPASHLRAPPWRTWRPQPAAVRLTSSADYTLGLCYGLANCPQLVRTESFTSETVRWFRAIAIYRRAEDEAVEATATPPEAPAVSIPDDQLQDASVDHRERWEPAADVASDAGLTSAASPAASPSARQSSGSESENESLVTDFRPAGSAPSPTDDAIAPPTENREPVLSATRVDPPAGIATHLGGAFYLINLLTHLQLPWGIESLAQLNPWELLGAVTADLLGERAMHYQSDPLWGLLRELAHLKPNEPWGAAMNQPIDVGIPPDWLARFGIGSLPDSDETEFDRRAPSLAQTTPALAWWLFRTRPVILEVLNRMLYRDSIWHLETLMAKPARLIVTHTHIDVHMPLDAIDIDVRCAGLDRDPGWVPEFGYIVTFHFQANDGH